MIKWISNQMVIPFIIFIIFIFRKLDNGIQFRNSFQIKKQLFSLAWPCRPIRYYSNITQVFFFVFFFFLQGYNIWNRNTLITHFHQTPGFQYQRQFCPSECVTRSMRTIPKLSRSLRKGIKEGEEQEGTGASWNVLKLFMNSFNRFLRVPGYLVF